MIEVCGKFDLYINEPEECGGMTKECLLELLGLHETKAILTLLDGTTQEAIILSSIEGIPRIVGADDTYVWQDSYFNPYAGVTAYDADGNEIEYTVTGRVDTSTVGDYVLTYTATSGEHTVTVERTVTVREITKRTVIYEDGRMIINELSTDSDNNRTIHGEEVGEYFPLDADHPYVYTQKEDTPWYSERALIKTVRFGSEVAPTSTAYWFGASNIEEIRWENCDTESILSTKSMFYDCVRMYTPNMSALNFSNATDMSQMFRGCIGLIYINLQRTIFGNGTATGFIQGCTHLELIYMQGANTESLTQVERFYADCSSLRKIFATDEARVQQFPAATASGNCFRACTSIEGGNGTTFDSSKVTKEYARIDAAGTPGYLTFNQP